MDYSALLAFLQNVASGKIDAKDAAKTLAHISMEAIGYAHIDHQRSLRKGFPEVIFGMGKSPEQIIGIMEKMTFQESAISYQQVIPNYLKFLI